MRAREFMAERQQQFYLRLGDLPEGGKSAIGAAPNIYKHIERAGRTHEAGVSVYPVEWDPEINRFVIDCNNLASLDGLFGQRRPAYIVTGRRIGKYGMDNEPLLRDVNIVKEVPYDQLNVPGWGSTPQPEDFLIDYNLDENAQHFISGEDLIRTFGDRASIMPFAKLPEMAKKSVHHWMVVDGENDGYKSQKYGYLEIPTVKFMEILYNQMNDDPDMSKQEWVDNWMNNAGGLSNGYRYPKDSIWPVIWGHGFEDGSHRLDKYLKMKLPVIPVVVCL